MLTVHFLKPAYYDPRVTAHQTKFDGYRLTALRRQDPRITPIKVVTQNIPRVFCSSSARARQTAYSFTKQQPVETALLDEVLFDLARLVSVEEYDAFGSSLVRERFIESFIADNLLESRQQLRERILKLLCMLHSSHTDSAMCFSHSFYMKILEAYVLSDYTLFEQPEALRNYISTRQPTYPYGKGFTLKI